ncbi:unnamed protein product [Microthlaspi erraticum]|uniref:Uncharacterized protein n=1 Tax=Microthlaspi erraticum TaxID=1685480 RepID=A0A6D2LI93_9BRAS|nr:unnamed protein product [Microthlaspi erraticum]
MAWRQWRKDDDKLFETALVLFPENFPNRFQAIADHLQIPVEEVMFYYDALVHDIELIESDCFPIADYPVYWETGQTSSQSTYIDKQRKRGVAWSQEERKLFLEGLDKKGKGDWKGIARDYVKTRSATQVASHAQKYYLRQQNVGSKAKKRVSIHDTTSVDADNSTVPRSDFGSMTTNQPHFGQQMPIDDDKYEVFD